MLACTWLFLGNKPTPSPMLPITDRLPAANTSNSQRANSTLVPRGASDCLSLGEVGIAVPVCHGRGTGCIRSTWPPILTSSPEALLGVISREGLVLSSIQNICIIFCLATLDIWLYLVMGWNGIVQFSLLLSQHSHQVPCCSLLWLLRASIPDFPSQVITQLHKHRMPLRPQSHCYSGLLFPGWNRTTKVLRTDKVTVQEAIHPLSDFIYLSLKWQSLD